MELGKAIQFNPSERIAKGKLAKKIPMEKLTAFEKKIKGFEYAEYSASPKFRNGDTLVAKITPCLENGKTAQVDILENNEVAFGSSEFIVLRQNESSINDFIFYLAKSPAFRKRAIGCMEGTSGRKRVNEGALKLQVLPFPDKTTQQKIATVLSSLDSKIELNNRINSELEAMAKILYDYWFVQFDFPDTNGKPYKTSGGKMIWNKELKREIPEGWEVQHLSNIANITTGKLDSNAEVIGAKYPFYTCASEPSATDNFAFDDTVILIAGNNASGNFHINRYKGKFNAYQRTYIVTSKKPIELEYLYQVLKTETISLKSQGKGSQTKFLTIGMLTYIKTFVNTGLMEQYNRIVNPMYEQQVIIRSQNQQLSSLRDWLLPMLMNGQVKVGDSMDNKASYEIGEEMRMAAEPGKN